MKIIVLGSGAGGGCPQWNSNSIACSKARQKDSSYPSMTQCSIAFSSDGLEWFIVNASPDIRQQINDTPELYPSAEGGIRNSPIRGVILTNGEIDAIAGLLTLRERHKFSLFATDVIHEILYDNKVFNILDAQLVTRIGVSLNRTQKITKDIRITLIPVLAVDPLYARATQEIKGSEYTTGLIIEHSDKKVVFIPACARLSPVIFDAVRNADLLFFDGTFWDNEEMISIGAGRQTAKAMGHIAINDVNGVLNLQDELSIKRKLFIHLNNTNPILHNALLYHQILQKGWDISYDGQRMEI